MCEIYSISFIETNCTLYVRLTGEEHAVLSHTHNNLQELMLQRHVLPSWTLLLRQRNQIQHFHSIIAAH